MKKRDAATIVDSRRGVRNGQNDPCNSNYGLGDQSRADECKPVKQDSMAYLVSLIHKRDMLRRSNIEKAERARENETARQIDAKVVETHQTLNAFLGSDVAEKVVESPKELRASLSSSVESYRQNTSADTFDNHHVETGHYYALFHSHGHDLAMTLNLLPDDVFMRFIGMKNPKLLCYTVEKLRALHAVRLALLLSYKGISNEHIHDLMSEKSIFDVVGDVNEKNGMNSVITLC